MEVACPPLVVPLALRLLRPPRRRQVAPRRPPRLCAPAVRHRPLPCDEAEEGEPLAREHRRHLVRHSDRIEDDEGAAARAHRHRPLPRVPARDGAAPAVAPARLEHLAQRRHPLVRGGSLPHRRDVLARPVRAGAVQLVRGLDLPAQGRPEGGLVREVRRRLARQLLQRAAPHLVRHRPPVQKDGLRAAPSLEPAHLQVSARVDAALADGVVPGVSEQSAAAAAAAGLVPPVVAQVEQPAEASPGRVSVVLLVRLQRLVPLVDVEG
mmetsp:Transcript_50172/g.166141  ORF Transcript_50172/g.166141 Transcript_50172/m.166141 type:complete len:266 (+) Transcript_50172:126-923(+)